MHGVRQAEAAKKQQAQRNAHMEANANLAAQSETNRNIEAQKSSNAEKESVKQAQTQRESLLQKAKIAQRSKEARAQGQEQEMSMSRSLKDVSDQNADGLKEAQTASLKDREAHDLLAESEASDLNSDAHVEAELAKNGQIHEEAQIQSLSEQEIIAQKSRETDADFSIERKVSKQASEYEEKLRADTERATAVELSQRQKELTEALVSDSSDSEVHHANAQNKAQHSTYNKEGEHATGDIASEAKQETISAKMSQAGVERRDSAEVQTVEGAVGAPSFTTQQASISKNMEKLIANLSDQVGNDVQEAASFLAGLDEAPKMMTADRSSQTLLDGSTIDVANTISEVGDMMDAPRMKSADAKRRAIKKTKRRREIEVLIQVLLTRQMESSKREKLLRMLLALGISEIEYRALVSKLGELEVAAQAMAAEARKTAEKEREALLVEPLLREPESPKMKSHENDPSAPPTIKSAPSVTRGAMYKRLLKEKEKNSNQN